MQKTRRKLMIGAAMLASLPTVFTTRNPLAYSQNSTEDIPLPKAEISPPNNTDLLKAEESEDIILRVPTLAENGGRVRVSVEANIPNPEWISLVVEKNPSPFTSWFVIREGAIPYVAVNLRFKESSKVTALVKSGDQYLKASEEVLVNSDGCT